MHWGNRLSIPFGLENSVILLTVFFLMKEMNFRLHICFRFWGVGGEGWVAEVDVYFFECTMCVCVCAFITMYAHGQDHEWQFGKYGMSARSRPITVQSEIWQRRAAMTNLVCIIRCFDIIRCLNIVKSCLYKEVNKVVAKCSNHKIG